MHSEEGVFVSLHVLFLKTVVLIVIGPDGVGVHTKTCSREI